MKSNEQNQDLLANNCESTQKTSKSLVIWDEGYNLEFYKQYQLICQNGLDIVAQIGKLMQQREQIHQRLTKLESLAEREFTDKFRNSTYERRQGSRRPPQRIKRDHPCEVQGCHKSYGSLGSMLQHMKIKHAQYYAERRERRGQREFLSLKEMGLQL